MENAIKMEQHGLKLDPMSLQINMILGIMYAMIRQHDRSEKHLDKILEQFPSHRTALEFKGWNYYFQGRVEAAENCFSRMSEKGWRYHRSACLGFLYAKSGRKEQALQERQKLYDLLASDSNFKSHFDIAVIELGLENFDEAIVNIGKAVSQRYGYAIWFSHTDPLFDDVRSYPGFQEIRRNAGLLDIPPLEDNSS